LKLRWIAAAGALAAGALIWALAPARAQDAPSPLLGKAVPVVKVKDLAGGDHTLAEFRGKIILLNFCASW
jgi:hypothetical protein